MLDASQKFTFGRAITLQLVSDNNARNVLKSFQEFAEKSPGGFFIPSTLHQNIQHVAILIHCSPKVMSLATDREEDLVQMPFVSTTRATTTEFIGVRLPEL